MTPDTRNSERHLSSFHVELLRVDEATPEERAWMERHLQACARCAEMAASFESHRREFSGAAPHTARSAQPIGRPAARRRTARRVGFAIALPAAAAIALFLSVRHPPAGPAPKPDISVKGGATLMMVARRGTRVFPVEPAVRLRANDQLRFVAAHVSQRYLLIAAVDGAGHTSIYFPYEGSESAAVGAGERVEIPGSIVVDDSPGPERFFALFSSRPLQTIAVRRALDVVGRQGASGIRNASKLDVGADEQASIVVEKETE